jgi:retron-type reverse transcriptase
VRELVLCASKLITDMYEKLMDEFDTLEDYDGYKKYNKPRIRNYKELAGVLYNLFPAHFYKAQDTILRYQEKHTGTSASIDTQEKITVIDIGAGIGTFTLALVDALLQHGTEPYPGIDVIIVEPNGYCHDMTDRYFQWINENSDIRVEYKIIKENFPERVCLEAVIKELPKDNFDFLIIAMCNLVHWLDNHSLYDTGVEFIKKVVDEFQPLHSIIFSVETKSKTIIEKVKDVFSPRQVLSRKMDKFQCSLASCFYNNEIDKNCSNVEVKYKNFPKSYYRKIKVEHVLQYWSGQAILYLGIMQLSRYENLDKAYYKARMALRREFPYDDIAIKLFEYYYKDSLQYCSEMLNNGYSFCPKPIFFKYPKDETHFRPIIIDNLCDSLVASTFLDVLCRKVDEQFSDFSYGNRINKNTKTEYIYEYFWYAWYHKYLSDILKEKYSDWHYIQLDIKSFYTRIDQKILLNKLSEALQQKDKRIEKMLESFICRDYDRHKPDCGIPQGPIASGFLANLYLDDIDKQMDGKKMVYRRYVDDIFLLSPREEELKGYKSSLDKLLQELKLELNKDKESNGSVTELREMYGSDPLLDNMNKRLGWVLWQLYALDRKYYQAYTKQPAMFIKWYSECLKNLGVFVSPEWLQRKINLWLWYKLGWIRSKRSSKSSAYFWRFFLRFPSITDGLTPPELWAKKFQASNPLFVRRLEELRSEIKSNLVELYENYDEYNKLDNHDKKKMKSKYRFFTYRAGVLPLVGVDDIVCSLLLKCPWLCSFLILRSYPKALDKMVANFNDLKQAFLRSVVLWAVEEVKDTKYVDFLQQILYDSTSPFLVQLMASQALLKVCAEADVALDSERIEKEIRLAKDKPYLLKNLILLLGMSGSKLDADGLLEEIKEECDSMPDHEKWMVEYAIAGFSEAKEIVAALDNLPDWLCTEDYPLIEGLPYFNPMY